VVARRRTPGVVSATLTRLRHRADPQAVCPVDQWAFTPRYTEGRCPLCDWEAPGGEAYAGHSGTDLFWPGMAVLLLVSLVMGILVVLTYLREAATSLPRP
jgi:hypothetical protein